MKKLLKKRVLIPLCVAVAVAIAAGAAYAYFTSTASSSVTEYTATPGLSIAITPGQGTTYLLPTAVLPSSLDPTHPTTTQSVDWETVAITNTANYPQDLSGTITTGNSTWDGVLHMAMWESVGNGYGSELLPPGSTLVLTETPMSWATLIGAGGLAANATLTFKVAISLDSSADNSFASATPTIQFNAVGTQHAK